MATSLPIIESGVLESALVERVRNGEVEALSRLVEMHRASIITLATTILRDSHEAEDVVQDSFLRAYQRIQHIKTDCSFRNYLYRIATRLCLDRLRKRRALFVPDVHDELCSEEDIASRLCVERALDMLNPQMRTILILREVHNYDYAEIAGMLNVPVGTVRSRLHFAREKFRKIWIQEVGF